MKLLALDRSTDTQSAALAVDGRVVAGKVFSGSNSRSSDWPLKVREFLGENGLTIQDIDEFLIGQGPGSFAGIRAALAFAQGLALPGNKKVTGLSSAMALTSDGAKTAVIGDARRDRYWVILYDGTAVVKDFTLVAKEKLCAAVPQGYSVVTPDGARIEALLRSVFADAFKGSLTPLAARLAEVAAINPDLPKVEPLPIYLQAAVRDNPG